MDGEKSVTIRYDFDHDFNRGDIVDLVNQNGHKLTEAKIVTQCELRADWISFADFEGHRRYTTTGELLEELSEYYPDAHLHPKVVLDVIVFETDLIVTDSRQPVATDGGTSSDGMERIDEDPNAETGDTRVRIDPGENDTYVLKREKYGLIEFATEKMGDDESFERYDWHLDEKFVLHGDSEAKQFTSMLAEEDAFDPTTLFFRQFSPDDIDLEPVRERIEMTMGALFENRAGAERHLQHAHAEIGGEKEDLYRYVDTDADRNGGGPA